MFWFLGSHLFGWGQNNASEDIIFEIWERCVIDHTTNQIIEKIICVNIKTSGVLMLQTMG